MTQGEELQNTAEHVDRSNWRVSPRQERDCRVRSNAQIELYRCIRDGCRHEAATDKQTTVLHSTPRSLLCTESRWASRKGEEGEGERKERRGKRRKVSG